MINKIDCRLKKNKRLSFCKRKANKDKRIILNKNSKSGVIVFIDKNGHKGWKWKNKKGAIYSKNWKKTIKPYGTIIWDIKKPETKIAVSKFDYSPKPKNWEVQITGLSEARKGYPNSKVGITKSQALAFAKSYMRKH